MATLMIVRGLPGAGKSTLGQSFYHIGLVDFIYEDDMYFTNPDTGEYIFDKCKLEEAHDWCKSMVKTRLLEGKDVAVCNTSAAEWEVSVYTDIAKEVGASIISLIVENRSGTKSIHSVPDNIIDNMMKRFSVKL